MKIVNRKKVKPYITLDGSLIREFFAYRNSALKNLSLAEAVVAPNKETILHCHKNAQKLYYILRGKARIWVGKKSAVVKKDDTILIMPQQQHKIRNTGRSNLVFLCICSPCYEHNDTRIVEKE